ncbi:hypothetical protein UFOVP276_191 [uncultured Caudovirales phage]|uniref:Uncharacterized protein n=1 Tax=uncultured Caudovirales phage TaxID=2100421 RepID=A0A6J5LLT9_9CAUD|nr:hypothetical protein UFOVP127_85 [uncultured Caudovirales phage]CAB4135235.1 hypothetical protein UFOVP276_191 [uncultured Caudovirales phage]
MGKWQDCFPETYGLIAVAYATSFPKEGVDKWAQPPAVTIEDPIPSRLEQIRSDIFDLGLKQSEMIKKLDAILRQLNKKAKQK